MVGLLKLGLLALLSINLISSLITLLEELSVSGVAAGPSDLCR